MSVFPLIKSSKELKDKIWLIIVKKMPFSQPLLFQMSRSLTDSLGH